MDMANSSTKSETESQTEGSSSDDSHVLHKRSTHTGLRAIGSPSARAPSTASASASAAAAAATPAPVQKEQVNVMGQPAHDERDNKTGQTHEERGGIGKHRGARRKPLFVRAGAAQQDHKARAEQRNPHIQNSERWRARKKEEPRDERRTSTAHSPARDANSSPHAFSSAAAIAPASAPSTEQEEARSNEPGSQRRCRLVAKGERTTAHALRIGSITRSETATEQVDTRGEKNASDKRSASNRSNRSNRHAPRS